MAPPDVESEIYEHLYGLPRRDRRNGRSAEQKIVIADGMPSPDRGDLKPLAVSHAPVRRPRSPRVDLGHLAGVAAELLATAALGTRRAAVALRPAGDAAVAAARRHPAPATALVWALLATPMVFALLLSSAGAGAASTRLQPGPPARFVLPAPAARAHPTAARRAPPRTTSTSLATASSVAQANPGPATASTPRRSTTTSVPAHHKTTSSRRHHTSPAPPRRPPSIHRPASHEEPARRPGSGVTPSTPGTTTPATPGGTGTATLPTGGQPAPGN